MGTQVIHAQSLERLVTTIVEHAGADPDVAAEVGRHLTRANLSGHDSHGAIRVPQYLRQIDEGELRPAARPEVITDSRTGGLVDAGRGFGQFSTAFALDWAMEHARENGMAVATVRHSMHIGRLGEYTERAASSGLVGMMTAGAVGPSAGFMGMPGASGRFFGTNPWSFGFPGERPVIFDGSTSAVAEGKVRLARDTQTSLPPGCITDRDGNATRDPADLYGGGALLPLGGDVAGHKGYGFALAAALLGGLAMVDDPEPTMLGTSLAGSGNREDQVAGVFLLVVDPGTFASRDGYRALVDNASRVLGEAPAATDSKPLVPGEPEAATRERRLREGIPLAESTWQELLEAGKRFGIQPD